MSSPKSKWVYIPGNGRCSPLSLFLSLRLWRLNKFSILPLTSGIRLRRASTSQSRRHLVCLDERNDAARRLFITSQTPGAWNILNPYTIRLDQDEKTSSDRLWGPSSILPINVFGGEIFRWIANCDGCQCILIQCINFFLMKEFNFMLFWVEWKVKFQIGA